MEFLTDRRRVSGLGSAKEGVGHWWTHRITSVALIPLTPLFVFPFASSVGGGAGALQALYAQPFHALVGVLFVLVTAHHLMQGLQVVIEDYVHAPFARTAALMGNTFFCAATGLAGAFAILKIAFAA
ncbi:MAG: succinate dehydrogenase, hydrophobic membrane anchor protein [Pseudomonadota bacterium]